jgi:hypothetical protein
MVAAMAAVTSGCGQMSNGTTTAAGRPSGTWQSASTALRLSSRPSVNPARTVTPRQDWVATSMTPAAISMLLSVTAPGTASTSAGASGGTDSRSGLR